LTWHTELLARFGALPFGAALEFEFARATHALHDFRRAGIESEGGGKNHAYRFFCAVGQSDVVADAFAVKVDVGLCGDGCVVDFFGGHGSGVLATRGRLKV